MPSKAQLLVLIAAGLAASCGSDAPPDKKVATGEQARAHMGIVPSSCWRYRIPAGRTNTFATLSIRGPDERPIAGRAVYIRQYVSASGNDFREEYFDFGEAPKMKLARSIDGRGAAAIVKTYDAEPLPLYGSFDFDAMNALKFDDQVYQTTSTPMGGMAEDHKWTVLAEDEQVVLHDGSAASAFKLSYQVAGKTAFYWLVPGYGFAKFTDLNSQDHQVCAACVADTPGGCSEMQCQLACQ